MKEFYKSFSALQSEIKVTKDNFNGFGKYSYRKCEDILSSLKPLLLKHELFVTLSDEVVQVGDRYYVVATSVISDGQNSISNKAFARESNDKKGMDESQITGAASSYARKYALSGLLGLDDEKDPDIPQQQPIYNKPVIKSEPYEKKDQLINNIKILLTKLTEGESVAAKSLAINGMCGVGKLEDLKNKPIDDLEFMIKRITSTIEEKNSRPKGVKDVHFKV